MPRRPRNYVPPTHDETVKHITPTLRMHAANVEDAQQALEGAREALDWWIRKAHDEGISHDEVTSILGYEAET